MRSRKLESQEGRVADGKSLQPWDPVRKRSGTRMRLTANAIDGSGSQGCVLGGCMQVNHGFAAEWSSYQGWRDVEPDQRS